MQIKEYFAHAPTHETVSVHVHCQSLYHMEWNKNTSQTIVTPLRCCRVFSFIRYLMLYFFHFVFYYHRVILMYLTVLYFVTC